MLKGFKEFVMRGNVIDLAVGVVIGAAFGALVNQLTASFLEPLIAVVAGGGVEGGTFTVDGVVFDWGAFVNAVITFVITAAGIYFLVVAPFNSLRHRRESGQETEAEPSNEEKIVLLLDQIAKELSKDGSDRSVSG
jgi:large conductance mechanosensitive channel